jgi:recombinational DNA repair protein RecT
MSKKTVFRRMSKWLPLSPEAVDAIGEKDFDSMKPAKGEASAPRYEVENLLEDEPQAESVEVAEVMPPEKVEEKTSKADGELL